MRKFTSIIVFLSMIIFLFSCGLLHNEKKRKKVEHIKILGQPIVDALYKYHKDQGRYPENYIKLIPNYINKISNLPDGYSWGYFRIDNNKHFVLIGRYEGYGPCKVSYSSQRKKWKDSCVW